MFKNVAAKFMVFAFDSTTNLPKTGDAANITAYVSKDYGSVTVLADTSATEMDSTNAKGYYLFDAAQGETNGDCLMVSAKSSTSNIVVVGAPAVIYTRPTTGWLAPTTAARTLTVDASGNVTLADAVAHGGTLGSSTATLALSRLSVVSQSSNTTALTVTGNGSGKGSTITGGATGAALALVGGGTSGDGLDITTTSGDGVAITPTAGNAIVATANGTSKHGFVITGGTAGTSDGLKAVAGSGGVPIRGNITANITGTIDTVTTATNVTTVNGLAANVITATSINADAITAAKIADGAIDAATFAAGAINAAAIASNAITAAKVATDAIGAAQLAADAVTEIQSGLATSSSITTLQADTDDIQTRLPAALTAGGNIKADVQVNSDKTGYALTSGERNSVADALLARNIAGGSSTGRIVTDALRLLRNKWSVAAGTLTVTQEDDTTAAWTATVSSDAAAVPIIGSDPA